MGVYRLNVILCNFFTFKPNTFSIIKTCFSIPFSAAVCFQLVLRFWYSSFSLFFSIAATPNIPERKQNIYIQKYILKTNTFSFQFLQYFSIWYLFQYPQRNKNTSKIFKNPIKSMFFRNFSAHSQNKPSI